MNAEQALEWMKLFNEKIQEQKYYLSELDTPIGDGDHGGNMARGMAAVMENLEGKQFETSSDVFKLVLEIKTIGLALSGATVPEVGKPGFILEDDEFEYGVGIHGEPGYKKEKMQPSAQLASELVEKLSEGFQLKAGERYGLLINGLGSTPLMEQYVFANDVAKLLHEKGVELAFKKIGNYMTSIDMAGLSLTLIRLADDEWLDALNAPVTTPAW